MVSIHSNDIIAYINELIANNANISMIDFATELHSRFYNNIDISFMNEFFDISSREKERQFIIEHDMLIKYGVVVSERSNDIHKRLTNGLSLEEGIDFELRVMSQLRKQGAHLIKISIC